jgi:molybdopterin/thiamine biosynthesis adenylyltransferase
MQQAIAFYNRSSPEQDFLFRKALEQGVFREVHDSIHDQVKELILAQQPIEHLSQEKLEERAKDLIGNNPEAYGVWVYYPWSGRVVHLLDETDFVAVRTIRNKIKINSFEQELLSHKKVGVVGLSVGRSVCTTLALQRAFGELRIADFDKLELSNMNRLLCGVHEIGLAKTDSAVRCLWELDPFLKLSPFQEGLTERNMSEFFLAGGKLDLVVDECDSIAMKFALRRFAREQGIPVIMATSDRGLLDVERFDLNQNTPLFHGLIGPEEDLPHRIKNDIGGLTMQILNRERISARGKESLALLGKEIRSWPQLAEDVYYGGAQVAWAARKILLGKDFPGGRYYFDADEISGTA